MPEACLNLSTSQIFVKVDEFTALMIATALELGEKCSILSTADSFLNDDLKQLAEDAFRAVMDTSRDVFNGLKSIIATINYITDVGIAILDAYLTAAYNLIFGQLLNARTLMNTLAGFIIDSVNTVATQACNTLNEAVTGLPSDVKIQNAGLAAAAAVFRTGKPQEAIRNLLQQRAIKELKQGFSDAKSALRNVPALPNLSPYVCVPI